MGAAPREPDPPVREQGSTGISRGTRIGIPKTHFGMQMQHSCSAWEADVPGSTLREAWILSPSFPTGLISFLPWCHLLPSVAHTVRSSRKHYKTLRNWEKKPEIGQRGAKRQREGQWCQEKGGESLKMDSVAITYAQGWIPKERRVTKPSQGSP